MHHLVYFSANLKSPQASGRVISKFIKNKKVDISRISQTAMWFLINHIFTEKQRTITSLTSNQRVDFKTVGWLQNSRMISNNPWTSCVWLHAKITVKSSVRDRKIWEASSTVAYSRLPPTTRKLNEIMEHCLLILFVHVR